MDSEYSEMIIDMKSEYTDKVSIVIVHKDRPRNLNLCLQSIDAVTSRNIDYEIILVDNGSVIGTDFITSLEKDIKVVRNKENLHFSRAANQGVSVADPNSKYFVFMHYDTVILSSGWLDLLMASTDKKSCGMVGLQTSSYMIGEKRYDFIQNWCMLVTRDCWEVVRPWPEKLPYVGNSFIMTMRAVFNGYEPHLYKNQSLVHHYGMRSVDSNEFATMRGQAATVIPELMKEIKKK